MEQLPKNKFVRLDLLKHYYLDGAFGDALILMLIHAAHKLEYLEAAKYIYEAFKCHQQNEENIKKIFNIVIMNICHMVNYCSDEGHSKRITPERFKAIFEFLCGNHIIEAESFLQLIKPSKTEFRDICLEKSKKSQKYLGEPAELVVVCTSHLIDYNHIANIMYKFLTYQGVHSDEIDILFTKRIELIGFRLPTKEAKQYVKRSSVTMVIDFFSQVADDATFRWFAEAIKMRPMYPDCTLRIKNRIARDLLSQGRLNDCFKVISEINDLLEDFEIEGIDDVKAKLAVFNALNFKALYYFTCKNISRGIQTLLKSYELSPGDSFGNIHTWVLNLRFLDPKEREEIFDQFKDRWPIQEVLKKKLLKWFKKSYELFEDPTYKNFKEYEKLKDKLGEFTEPRLSEAIDRIFLIHSLYFYASCNKMSEVYGLLETLQSKNYMIDYEYSLIILDVLYSMPTDLKMVDMLKKPNFISAEVMPNILAWDVYLRLFQETLNVKYWNKAMHYLDMANVRFYVNSKILKNFVNIILVSNKITIIEAAKFGVECHKFLNLISDIAHPEDFQKFKKHLDKIQKKDKDLEDNVEQDKLIVYRAEQDAYYEELIIQKASLTQNLKVVKNVSYWKVEGRVLSSKDLDLLNVAGRKVFVMVDSDLSPREIAKLYKTLEAAITPETKIFKISLNKEIMEKISMGKIYTDYTTGDEMIYLTAPKDYAILSKCKSFPRKENFYLASEEKLKISEDHSDINDIAEEALSDTLPNLKVCGNHEEVEFVNSL